MAAVSNQFTLYLSSEGDAVEIKHFGDGNPTIPEQLEAQACRTHEAVLAFLEKINNSALRDSLRFWHHHNPRYDGHLGTYPKGVAHECLLDQQISFVRYKIGEHLHGVRREPGMFCVAL